MKTFHALSDFRKFLASLIAMQADLNLPCVVIADRKGRKNIHELTPHFVSNMGDWQDEGLLWQAIAKGYHVVDYEVLDGFAIGEKLLGHHHRNIPPMGFCVLLHAPNPKPSTIISQSIYHWLQPFKDKGVSLGVPCLLSNISDFALATPSLDELLELLAMPYFQFGHVIDVQFATYDKPLEYITDKGEHYYYALPIDHKQGCLMGEKMV